MSLKELTKEKHTQAEKTPFMQAVFNQQLPDGLWADWTFQKTIFYGTIEGAAEKLGLTDNLPDLKRASYLYQDLRDMLNGNPLPNHLEETVEYHNYILSIADDPNKIMAHLYTWHMGDMFGGQMIKKLVPGPHKGLEFSDIPTLMNNIRAKLDDSMGEEANVAFSWAIRMMEAYNGRLD